MSSPLDSSMDFITWAICLPRWILKCRTAFGFAVRRSFTAVGGAPSLPTAAFPLPLPHPGVWFGGGPGLSKRRFRRLAMKRLLNLVVLALDFQYLGRAPTAEEIGRCPNQWHLRCYDRLRTLLAACGTDLEPFPLAPGRSGPELGACLFQLEQFLAKPLLLERGYRERLGTDFVDDPSIFPEELYPQLSPYRSLDSTRLKIVGSGSWDMQAFIDDELWLPYVEPKFLLHDEIPAPEDVPNFSQESYEENLKLIKLWDSRGLLEFFPKPVEDGFYSRVFNAFKNVDCDRQIGDRRYPNQRERRTSGPSHHLPQGALLCGLQVPRYSHRLLGSIADRRDFYHQAKVTSSRAQSNLLPFAFDAEDVKSTSAYQKYMDSVLQIGGYAREVHGDHLGFGKAPKSRGKQTAFYAGFRSLFQGDHLGVEFALSAHEGLLARGGLLNPCRRLLGHDVLPLGHQWEGLIIDDYFAVGAEPLSGDPLNSFAAKSLATARVIYGSVEKDLDSVDFFKAAGAEVNSTMPIARRGAVTVGAPSSKRLALSALSLRAAALPCITSRLCSRLAGNWVSVLLYRRCLSCIISGFFSLSAGLEQTHTNQLSPLPRKIADELVVLATLAPIMVSNVALPFSQQLHAVDASLGLGAIVETKVPLELAQILWLGGDRRGQSLPLDSPARGILASLSEESDDAYFEPFQESIGRPLMMYYDFVEFFGGAGVVSKFASSLGLICAPPLDLSSSQHYDLHDLRLLEWCMHMLSSGRFRSCMIEPPCTSFSPAAHPSVRSYVQPWGYNLLEEKTLLGNTSALRGFILLRCSVRHRRPSLFEQPRLSKMCWTHQWKAFLDYGLAEAVVASCQFGSPHRKEFRLLCHLLDHKQIDTRCPGGHDHVRIEGKFTKPSATYVDDLALHFAKAFRAALERLGRLDDDPVAGHESLVVNDVLLTAPWRTSRSWRWQSKSHIKELALGSADARHVVLSDSQVAIGCLAKGRSPSFLLQRQCKIIGALQAAAGIYLSFSYAPTRLNIADDPTRLADLRNPMGLSLVERLPWDVVQRLHASKLPRPYAGWVRLLVLIVYAHPCEAHFVDSTSCQPATFTASRLILWTSHLTTSLFFCFGFCLLCCSWTCLLVVWFKTSLRCLRIVAPLAFILSAPVATAMVPGNEAERARAIARTAVTLEASRAVKVETRRGRERLLEAFRVWLYDEHGVLLSVMLTEKPVDAEGLAKWLVSYGKSMFLAGKSYGRYSETINAVASARPAVRKHLGEAWDLAFAWLADEPHQHNPALPLSILLGMISVAIMWGWPVEGALLALTWAGVLRIGETLLARRSDLVLPSDGAPGTTYILMRIRTPKTRGRAAQHQAARVDAQDFVQLISKVFENLGRGEPLWPFSAGTMRKRFEALLRALSLPTTAVGGQRPFTLGSLRPGGATHLLYLTEDSELTRRRGRWLSYRTMEIYLQEILVATCVGKLSREARERVEKFASGFPEVLLQAISFMDLAIPPTTWNALFKHMAKVELG